MLKVISLHTLQQIFETEALTPLSPMAKMSYISCLMYYFEDMPMDLESSESFDIVKAQVKTYHTSEKYFKEMAAAGLIAINEHTITFINHWRRHIDKTLLNKPTPEEYIGQFEFHPAADYELELMQNQKFHELFGMQYKLSAAQVKDLIKDFIQTQSAIGMTYPSISQITKHCLNWLNKKAPSVPKTSKNNPGQTWT